MTHKNKKKRAEPYVSTFIRLIGIVLAIVGVTIVWIAVTHAVEDGGKLPVQKTIQQETFTQDKILYLEGEYRQLSAANVLVHIGAFIGGALLTLIGSEMFITENFYVRK